MLIEDKVTCGHLAGASVSGAADVDLLFYILPHLISCIYKLYMYYFGKCFKVMLTLTPIYWEMF